MDSTSPFKSPVIHKAPSLLMFVLVLGALAAVTVGLIWFSTSGFSRLNGSGLTKTGAVRVMYTPDGFVPKAVTITQGTTVTFLQNQEGSEMWVASDDHPEHADYAGTTREKHCPDASGLSFDQCTKGVTYSFTFHQTGSWGYHNHEHPEATGTITVIE